MLGITEKILIRQIRKGDEIAFTTFYNRYHLEIYRFIYFKVSNEEKAQDLTSNTFMKVFNYLKTEQDIANLRALLFTTARNLVIDFYRERKDEVSLDALTLKDIVDDKDVRKQIHKKIEFEKILKAVKKLPKPYDDVIILRFVQELSFDEISEITKRTPANCRIISHRGLEKLKEILAENV